MYRILATLTLLFVSTTTTWSQTTSRVMDNVQVSSTTAIKIGQSKPISELIGKELTSPGKKKYAKSLKRVNENFKGRRGASKAVDLAKEHQGEDPLWQKGFNMQRRKAGIELKANFDGISDQGSPHDPSGDVSDEFYVQMVNATLIAVYDLDGNLIEQFSANTLWTEFGVSSEGDPIVLYDEVAERWILTEFTDPANALVAISDNKDPLGSYTAYNFSTPNFPDYPKYAISPKSLIFTSNEEGPGDLHQYFIDREALLAGAPIVTMQRVTIMGNTNTEAGFYVSTPVDWNGTNLPYDDKSIVVVINDSSWGSVAEDQIEVYSIDVDYTNQSNTQVTQTAIVTTPFDSYPCSADGFGFACTPQPGGNGLDAVPEVIMNIPHLRNFGTHESMVFNFVTDATDGDNLSAIRWVELRRDSESDWALYQEGTFAPDDGLDRYMGSIAMDAAGNIGLGYVVSSEDTFAGVRVTGRSASDPLGEMTFEEVVVVEGISTLNSFGRFGDYAQISVAPKGDKTFWYTTEYAGGNFGGAGTRIVAFQLQRDTFDLAITSITEPNTAADLGGEELVSAIVQNTGLNDISDFEVGLIFGGELIQSIDVTENLAPDSSLTIQFSAPIDMSAKGDYLLTTYVNNSLDSNIGNDTIRKTVSHLEAIDVALANLDVRSFTCGDDVPAQLTVVNNGAEVINTVDVQFSVNGEIVDTVTYVGSLSNGQSGEIDFVRLDNLADGQNTATFTILNANGQPDSSVDDNILEAGIAVLDESNFVRLIFNTDDFAGENSWSITFRGSDEVLASGVLSIDNTQEIFDVCVPKDSCYTLTVEDSYGDGMCCVGGDGNFSVIDFVGNTLLFNDGEFGAIAIENFCLDSDAPCSLASTFEIADASAAGVADGSILMEATGGIGPYRYSIDGGIDFQTDALFDGLLPGDYETVITGLDTSCMFTSLVTVGIFSGVYEVEGETVEVNIAPNPTDGVFKIDISNLPITDNRLQIDIYDLTGRLIQQRDIARYDQSFTGTFSLMAFPAGNYFLRVNHKKLNILEKIQKF